MDSHSFKSWREYHRVRAPQLDPVAKRQRLEKEAAKRVGIITTTIPMAEEQALPMDEKVEPSPSTGTTMVHEHSKSPSVAPSSPQPLFLSIPRTADYTRLSSPQPSERKRSRELESEEPYSASTTGDDVRQATKRLRVSDMLNDHPMMSAAASVVDDEDNMEISDTEAL